MRPLLCGQTALLSLALMLGGCRGHRPPPLTARYDQPIQSRDIARGGRIYFTLCAACHNGMVNPRGYQWLPGQMRRQIREGNHLMPPLSSAFLTDDDVEAVLAYLSLLRAIEGELPPPSLAQQQREAFARPLPSLATLQRGEPTAEPEWTDLEPVDSDAGIGDELGEPVDAIDEVDEVDDDLEALETGEGLDPPY